MRYDDLLCRFCLNQKIETQADRIAALLRNNQALLGEKHELLGEIAKMRRALLTIHDTTYEDQYSKKYCHLIAKLALEVK